MENSERLINIVEDHANMVHAIDSIACAIENGTEMPNFIPVMNDTVVTDQLGAICETITKLRKKLV